MTRVRPLTSAFLTLILLTPLLSTGEVFAQSDDTETDLRAGEIATSTETVFDAVEPERWFRSDRLTGSVDQGDFVVGPGRSEIELKPGQTIIQEISVSNRISNNRIFSIEVEDITGSSDASDALSLTGDERGPYSIRDYISFPEDTFELELGERARIPITISLPPDAEPGGYYGSVLISTVQSDGEGRSLGSRQPIVARIGSLLFLTVEGETVIEGETKDISLLNDKWWYESGPISMGILYENTGSIHLNPYGSVTITNMFGEEVGFVELEPWFVLPTSLRLREISWDREFLLGRYSVKAEINRGYEDVVDVVHVSFWVLPWKIVGGVFLILFIIIFTIRAFFRTFEFKRKGD